MNEINLQENYDETLIPPVITKIKEDSSQIYQQKDLSNKNNEALVPPIITPIKEDSSRHIHKTTYLPVKYVEKYAHPIVTPLTEDTSKIYQEIISAKNNESMVSPTITPIQEDTSQIYHEIISTKNNESLVPPIITPIQEDSSQQYNELPPVITPIKEDLIIEPSVTIIPDNNQIEVKKPIVITKSFMGKTPGALPVYNLKRQGRGITPMEQQGIVFCAEKVYQEQILPLSNNTARFIRNKIGGDWLVIIYEEGKPEDFNLTCVAGNDYMYFTLDTLAYQVCRLR